jgi:hypothetical protein
MCPLLKPLLEDNYELFVVDYASLYGLYLIGLILLGPILETLVLLTDFF